MGIEGNMMEILMDQDGVDLLDELIANLEKDTEVARFLRVTHLFNETQNPEGTTEEEVTELVDIITDGMDPGIDHSAFFRHLCATLMRRLAKVDEEEIEKHYDRKCAKKINSFHIHIKAKEKRIFPDDVH